MSFFDLFRKRSEGDLTSERLLEIEGKIKRLREDLNITVRQIRQNIGRILGTPFVLSYATKDQLILTSEEKTNKGKKPLYVLSFDLIKTDPPSIQLTLNDSLRNTSRQIELKIADSLDYTEGDLANLKASILSFLYDTKKTRKAREEQLSD